MTAVQLISPAEAFATQDEALLLDVRTPAEWQSAHIEGSLLMPLDALDLVEIRNKLQGRAACYIICQSGGRARQAAMQLGSASPDGPSIRVLDGGVSGWNRAGLPLIHGKKSISLERQVRIAAGSIVLCGIALSYFVASSFIAIPIFVGAGLVFSGVTDTCGMGMLLSRMPWNRGDCASGKSCSNGR
jgi:rhodanese-related sulfurtransferase